MVYRVPQDRIVRRGQLPGCKTACTASIDEIPDLVKFCMPSDPRAVIVVPADWPAPGQHRIIDQWYLQIEKFNRQSRSANAAA